MAPEWVSISDAAARLTALGDRCDRSTLSRYLSKHAEALEVRQDGKAKLVDFTAVMSHRRGNARVAAELPDYDMPVRDHGPVVPDRNNLTQAAGAARKVQAEADIKELQLAQMRGELVVAAEVDRAGRDAMALMVASMERAVETVAEAGALRYGWDARQVRVILKEYAREGLATFHQQMLGALDRIERNEAAGVADDDAGTLQ